MSTYQSVRDIWHSALIYLLLALHILRCQSLNLPNTACSMGAMVHVRLTMIGHMRIHADHNFHFLQHDPFSWGTVGL